MAKSEVQSVSSDQDRILVEKALAGDQRAYGALMNKYTKGLRHHVGRTVHRPRDVEDLVQETFIKAFKALDSYSPQFAFSTWLYRIATNHAIDFLRKRRLETVSLSKPREGEEEGEDQVLPDESYRPDKHIVQDQRRELIQVAIEKLPPKYKRVIELRHQKERSYREIAEELELPIGTVKAHIFRARRLLYTHLRTQREIL